MKRDPWLFYRSFYRGGFRPLGFCVLLSILQSVLVLPIALFVREVFDGAIPARDFSLLLSYCLGIAGLYLLDGGFTLWTRHLSLKTTKNAIKKMRDAVLERLYAFPRALYTSLDRKRVHSAVVQDTLRVDIMSNALVAQFIPALFVCLGLCVILLYLNPLLFLLTALVLPLIYLSNRILGAALRKKYGSYHSYFELFSKRIMTLLDIMDLTHLQAAEEGELSAQRGMNDSLRLKSQSQAWFNALYRIVQRTIILSSGIVILIFGGRFVFSGRMTLGELISFFAAVGLLRNNLLSAVTVFPQILEGGESLVRLHGLFGKGKPAPPDGGRVIDFKGRIAFESVSFSYADKPVLKDISFSVEPGEMVAVTGPNGAGKTTLVHLATALYRPDEGAVFADGVPYDEVDLFSLRRRIGVVQQDPVFFPGTILDNLTYGKTGVGRGEVEEALRLSLSKAFAAGLPEGLDTRIERKDQTLSAGELQRLALARALIGRPALLVLDEPVNHLDEPAMAAILENLRSLDRGPAILLISHKSRLLEAADRIYFLEGTRLREMRRP